MYFDASERIARRTTYPRSHIEKIDEFLAGPHIKRFELRQLQEKTHLDTDVSPMLEEYVRERVLKKDTVHFCPEHNVHLEKVNRSEGKCISCDKIYPFEDCPTKLVYERRREPDRQKATKYDIVTQSTSESGPWWQDPRFMIGSIIMVIIVAAIGFIGDILSRDTINISYPSEQITTTSTIELTDEATPESTVERTIESTDEAEVAIPIQPSLTLEIELTSEVTPEQTLEPGNSTGN